MHRILLQTQLADWDFTFVDDFLFLVELLTLYDRAAAILLMLEALGFLVSWKKVRAGQQTRWIGLDIDVASCPIRSASRKLEVATQFLDQVVARDTFSPSNVDRSTCRLRWCAQCVDWVSPIMQPLHALSAIAAKNNRHVTAGVLHSKVAHSLFAGQPPLQIV